MESELVEALYAKYSKYSTQYLADSSQQAAVISAHYNNILNNSIPSMAVRSLSGLLLRFHLPAMWPWASSTSLFLLIHKTGIVVSAADVTVKNIIIGVSIQSARRRGTEV